MLTKYSKMFVTCAALAALSACGGGGSSPTLPATAVASAASPRLVTLGDSITMGWKASDHAQFGYAGLLAAHLGLPLDNLGVGGSTAADVLTFEATHVSPNAQIITLYVGTNDLIGVEIASNPDRSNTAVLADAAGAAYRTSLQTIVADVHREAPNATLYIATVPNPANRSVRMTSTPAARDGFSRLAQHIREAIIATGEHVVDLECDPAMYDDANFPDPYEVHPNDRGHAAIAADFLAQIQHSTPVQSCKYQNPL